ncbi:MAG TPA: PepSY domain-containing protein [Stellaceae bacterium]|nr:PepSY domain-containing protein [Stellaceae bacterium]
MRRSMLAAAAAFPIALAVAAPAFSQTAPPAPNAPAGTGTPTAVVPLSEQEIQSALQAQGYSNIRTVKHDGDQYQLQAQRNGKPVLLMVDARTGRYSEHPS